MKKRVLVILLCLITAVLMTSWVSADESDANCRVFDEANRLNDSDESKLQERIEASREKYGMDVVIRIINMPDLAYESLEAYTDDYYNIGITGKYRFGQDGLLIFMNIVADDGSLDYWFNGCDKGAEIFDTYFIEYVKERTNFVSELRKHTNEDSYKALDIALDNVEKFLEQAATGEPYSYNNPVPKEPMSKLKFVILSAIEAGIALLFGKGYASRLRASMNTAVKRTEATEYIDKDSFCLTNSSDMFLYSNVTRTPIPTETSRSSGGGGSSIHMSGGHYHSGGGGHA
ncbi:MAG: TPM domain-containing protein [Lachnospiraceae bacterium]|nr:TPM domain-containing protein [Lachnospiraceae bacterium]